jgi:hypothetical protein
MSLSESLLEVSKLLQQNMFWLILRVSIRLTDVGNALDFLSSLPRFVENMDSFQETLRGYLTMQRSQLEASISNLCLIAKSAPHLALTIHNGFTMLTKEHRKRMEEQMMQEKRNGEMLQGL